MRHKFKRKQIPLFLGNCLDADEWMKEIEKNNPTDNVARFASFDKETHWRRAIHNNNPNNLSLWYERRN